MNTLFKAQYLGNDLSHYTRTVLPSPNNFLHFQSSRTGHSGSVRVPEFIRNHDWGLVLSSVLLRDPRPSGGVKRPRRGRDDTRRPWKARGAKPENRWHFHFKVEGPGRTGVLPVVPRVDGRWRSPKVGSLPPEIVSDKDIVDYFKGLSFVYVIGEDW